MKVMRWARTMHREAGIAIVALGAAAYLAACSDESLTDQPPPPAFEFLLSEPRPAPLSPGLGGPTGSAPRGDGIIYVSLPPGTVPDGHSATIRNLVNGFSATVAVVDGGFDPVLLVAAVGDSIEVVVTDGGGNTTRVVLAVPARKPPVVIRTVPPRRSTDVPLNSLIQVVFSEPMDPRTLTTTSVRLVRGSTAEAGQVLVSLDGLRAEFVPDGLLAPQVSYELEVTADVSDANGDRMEAPASVAFLTGPGSGLAVLPAGGDLQSDTIFATLNPFRVRVLRDGAPAPGVRVWWSHERSGSVRATSLTDDSGRASYVLRLGPSTCSGVGSIAPGVFITSENTFLAAVPGAGGSPVAFRSLTRAGNPTGLEAYATGDRGFPVGTRQVVQRGGTVPWAAMVVDAQGNPVDRAGTAVQWTVTSGGGTVDRGSSLTQDSYPCGFGGVTSTRHTPGPGVGEQQLVATLAGVAAAPVTYTAIAVDTIVEVLGDGVAQFAEDSLSLPVGVTIGWNWVCEPADNNQACSAHNVTFEDQPAAPVSSGTFVNGEHVRQFSAPGVYRYRCTNHSSSFRSGMVGMVVVR